MCLLYMVVGVVWFVFGVEMCEECVYVGIVVCCLFFGCVEMCVGGDDVGDLFGMGFGDEVVYVG